MLKTRQPIVTILGHVDHGKTSLLDALRETNIVAKEAGGITQSIGASVVTYTGETGQSKDICFIDTPGHALFSGMRQRGAKLADIALLIVDGSSGVKPQTREAIAIINKNQIPCIVVITKIDLPSASIENVLPELEKEGMYFESRGGQIPFVEVSAKNKVNLDKLLDLIILLAEINEIKADDEGGLESFVIESSKDKSGVTVSVVVRNGKLKIGQEIYTDTTKGKIKALFDWQNKPTNEVLPGEPARIMGFVELPEVGAIVFDKPVENKIIIDDRNFVRHDTSKIPILIKASNLGSIEALKSSIPSEFLIIEASVGDVLESDVLNAKANGAFIFAFESKISSSVKKLADIDSVTIERFDVIYELLEKLDSIIKGETVNVIGRAEILAIFPFDGKKVAGSKVLSGRIEKSSDLRLYRDGKEFSKIKAVSIKKQKQEVLGVSQGEECGILFTPQLDFKVGDAIIAVGK